MRTLASRLREENEGGMEEDDSDASDDSGALRDEDGADDGVVMVERNALINGFVRIRTGISSTMFEKVN